METLKRVKTESPLIERAYNCRIYEWVRKESNWGWPFFSPSGSFIHLPQRAKLQHINDLLSLSQLLSLNKDVWKV